MRETGDEFDVTALGNPAERYRLTPVVLFGRAGSAADGPTRGSWSSWSYHLKGNDEVVAIPRDRPEVGERPTLFTLRFGEPEESEARPPFAPVTGDVEVRLADD